MRIGFDSKRIFSNFRGLGSYSRNLVRNLCREFPEFEYYLYTPERRTEIIDQYFAGCSNLKIRLPSIEKPRIIGQAWRNFGLKSVIEKDRLDIYHGLSHQLPIGIQSGSTKWVVTIHDLIFLRFPQYFSAVDRWIYEKKIRYAIAKADSIIAISEQTKKDLISYMDVPEEKVTVLYQSIDPLFAIRISDKEKATLRKKYELPQRYVLYVGALLPHKNVLAILKAMHLMKRYFDYHLVIVGSGLKYQKKMIQYARQSGLTNRLVFLSDLGYVGNEELRGIYQMASIFVYPSLFEGFGLPILEALSSKVPVIASYGLEEAAGPESLYFQTGDDGESLAEAVQKFIGDRNLGEAMIEGGFSYVQKFDPVITSQSLASHYRGLLV